MVRREIAAERWRVHGRQTVAVHTGGLGELALRWRAIWEVGGQIASLDGVSALHVAGLKGYQDDLIHVSVMHTHDVEPIAGVRIHKLIRRVPGEILTNGLPRTQPAIAAIRAAHWAASDRQAALLLCLPIQQRLVAGEQLLARRHDVRGRTRRRLIDQLIGDIADGAHSLGELDVGAACRKRGLAEPDRQEIRFGPRGTIYLDLRWRNGLVVEVDGAAHRWGLAVAEDNLRANAVTLGEDIVLRIDLVGWRLAESSYMDQVCAGYWLREHRAGRSR